MAADRGPLFRESEASKSERRERALVELGKLIALQQIALEPGMWNVRGALVAVREALRLEPGFSTRNAVVALRQLFDVR